MKRLWQWLRADTLGKRLFLLMWAALVLSHALAFVAVRWLYFPTGPVGPGGLPTFPSLPPTPALRKLADAHALPPGPAPWRDAAGAAEGSGEVDEIGEIGGIGDAEGTAPGDPGPVPQMTEPRRMQGGAGLPTEALLLDYGIRLLVIALAALWGSRWLALPVQRLVTAAHGLGGSLGKEAAPPQLNEREGSSEVREAAQLFNQMAGELHQQFKARGLLMAAISHDLRTPMTRLRIRLETLGLAPAVLSRSAADLQEMNLLLDQALALYRGQSVNEALQSTDLVALLQSLCDDLAEQGQAISFEPPQQASVVCGLQPQTLRRVLDNLIGNALRYGGRAELSLHRDDESKGAGWRVSVADAGPGIPEDQLEAVFQPFYRLDASRSRPDGPGSGGNGLGLYIARELAGLMGAKLSLHARPGGGLCARLWLPQR